MGGVEATRRIRALSNSACRIPIIALTANAEDEDVAEYYAAGMQNVIEKPVSQDTLLAALDAAVGPGERLGATLVSQTAAE